MSNDIDWRREMFEIQTSPATWLTFYSRESVVVVIKDRSAERGKNDLSSVNNRRILL